MFDHETGSQAEASNTMNRAKLVDIGVIGLVPPTEYYTLISVHVNEA